MKMLERFLNLIGGRRRLLLGAVDQQYTPKEFLYTIRASAFLRLTGKPLTPVGKLPTENSEVDISKNLSPSRRLLRKGP